MILTVAFRFLIFRIQSFDAEVHDTITKPSAYTSSLSIQLILSSSLAIFPSQNAKNNQKSILISKWLPELRGEPVPRRKF